MNRKNHYRLAMAITVLATLMLMWLSLGVGIIGADGDPANRMYFGVLLVAIIGAASARLHATGMSRVLCVMTAAQATITMIAVLRGLGQPWSGPAELIILNGFFIAMFATAAWLFHRASTQRGDVANA